MVHCTLILTVLKWAPTVGLNGWKYAQVERRGKRAWKAISPPAEIRRRWPRRVQAQMCPLLQPANDWRCSRRGTAVWCHRPVHCDRLLPLLIPSSTAVSAPRQPVRCPTVCSFVGLPLRLLVSVCVAPCHWKRKRSRLASGDRDIRHFPRTFSSSNYHLKVMRWPSTANRRSVCIRRLTYLWPWPLNPSINQGAVPGLRAWATL